MRSIQASVVIPQGVDAVWAALSRPEGLQELAETFSGWGTRLDFSVENGAVLGHGAQLLVATSWGRPVMRLRVSAWEPPTTLDLVATEPERRLSPFHMLASFKLLGTDPDRTEVGASVVIIFLHRPLEILSLLLPVRFLYVRRLERALKKLHSRSRA